MLALCGCVALEIEVCFLSGNVVGPMLSAPSQRSCVFMLVVVIES